MLLTNKKALASTLTLVLGSLAIGAAASSASAPRFSRGRILVGFRPNVSSASAAGTVARFGARFVGRSHRLPVQVLQLPAGANEASALQALRQRPEVAFAEVDRGVRPSAIPNDPNYGDAWHLPKIQAPAAWNLTTGSADVTIAVLDTGVDSSQPDLQGKLLTGWNFYDNSADTSDTYGHGTPVAGVAAAATNNSVGVAGVAWGAKILPCKVTDPDGYGYYSAMADALTWAADQGARVANVSFEVTTSATVTAAAQYFESKGGVVVISAGNEAFFDSTADNPDVLTVSATDDTDSLTSWSNSGNNVDISAPGDWIYTTDPGSDSYSPYSGTSFSAPIVAGVAALMISANPTLTPAEIMDLIKSSADDLGPAGWDSGYGAGRVNAYAAVSAALGSDTTAPTVSFTSPTSGASVSGTVSVQVSASDNLSVASVSLSVDGTSLGSDTMSPYSFSWNTALGSNGAHTLHAVATDGAGNSSSADVTVTVSNTDTTAPTVNFTSPSNGGTVSGTITAQVSASDNVGVSYVAFYVDGSLQGTRYSAPYNFSWNTTGVSNGSHSLKATAYDAAGNSANRTISVTVSNDTTAPTVSFTAPSSGAVVAGTVTVTASASDNVGVTSVTLSIVGGSTIGTKTSSPWSFSWNTAGLSSGSYTLRATAYDAAGNSSYVNRTVTVDNTAPTVSITSPANGATVNGTISVTVSTSDNVGVTKVELYVDNVLKSTSTTSPFSNSLNTNTLSHASHTLKCKAYDAVGNVTTSATITVNH